MRFPEGLFIDVERTLGEVKICCTPQGKFCTG